MIRSRWGVGLLVLTVLIVMADFSWRKSELWTNLGAADLAGEAERRLDGLKEYLPSRGEVGYLTDCEPGGELFGRFIVTQYVIAPAILVEGAGPDLVIGDFKGRVDVAALCRANGLELVRDFGGGVMLFRRVK